MASKKSGDASQTGRDACTGKYKIGKTVKCKPEGVRNRLPYIIQTGKVYDLGRTKKKASKIKAASGSVLTSGISKSIRTALGITKKDDKIAKKVLKNIKLINIDTE